MLRDTRVCSGELYIGRNAGEKILDEIANAKKSLKIVTPYVSDEFVHILLERVRDGIGVCLILSSDFLDSQFKRAEIYRKIIKQNRQTDVQNLKRRKTGLITAYAGYFCTIFFLILGFKFDIPHYMFAASFLPLFLAIHIFFYHIRIYQYSYEQLIKLSVTMSPYSVHRAGQDEDKYFTHAKIFIVDEKMAYVGSLNFTKAGFHRNYETRVLFNEPSIVRSISSEFDYLFSNENTNYLDLKDLEKALFNEPAH